MTALTNSPGATAAQWTSEVSVAAVSPELVGHWLDRPAIGESGEGWTLTVAGWAVGRHARVREVQVVLEGAVVRRALVNVVRADVGEQLGITAHDLACGFRLHVGVLGLPREARLVVQAVTEDGSHVDLGSITVAHRPIETGYVPQLQPILVTSLGRMGTTWLMRLLAAHPGVVVHEDYPYELGVARYWAHLLRVGSAPADHLDSCEPDSFTSSLHTVGHNPYFGDFLWKAPELCRWLAVDYPRSLGAHVQEVIDTFYGQVAARQGKDSARFVAEKSLPDTVPDVLYDLYPSSREVVLVRDIRDVICSVLAFDVKRGRRSFGREYLEDREFVTQLRVDLERLIGAWRRRSERAFLVYYEELVTEPVATLTALLTSLELDAEPGLVARVLDEASVPTPELEMHRTSASAADSLGRWRKELTVDHPHILELCDELFDPLLEELGYPTSGSRQRVRALERDLDTMFSEVDGPQASTGAIAGGADS